jgi:predicted  nucleic acid-binding Zn-ribbon protein
MNAKMARLLDLQDIDRQLYELQEQLNNYPTVWEDMKKKLRRRQEEFDKAQTAHQDRTAERTRIEQELRLSADKMKQYQAQQMIVKTPKEYEALNAQMDNLKKNMIRLEERATDLLDTDSASKEVLEKAEADLNGMKVKAREERERIRDQVNKKKQLQEKLTKEREEVRKQVDPELLRLYEQTRRRWELDPVVPVRQGSCTGCHFAVLPNRLVVLHCDTETLTCDNCGRIFSHDETFVPAEQTS